MSLHHRIGYNQSRAVERYPLNQILRHLVYHFDDNDLSKISNLPFEYWEYIEPFERLVACLYEGDGEL